MTFHPEQWMPKDISKVPREKTVKLLKLTIPFIQ